MTRFIIEVVGQSVKYVSFSSVDDAVEATKMVLSYLKEQGRVFYAAIYTEDKFGFFHLEKNVQLPL